MQRKQLLGSLVVTLGLLSGQAFASLEPNPGKELEPIDNREAEVVPATLDLAFQEVRPETDERPEDFLPDLPILLDGKLYSAEELREAGVHLPHYVLDAQSAEMQVVQGFRTADELRTYLERTDQMPSEDDGERHFHCNIRSYFFDGVFYGGPWFSVAPGNALATLGSWNNRISSVWGSPCARWTVLFDHTWFQGRQLWIGRGWAVPNLAVHGWLAWYRWRPYWYTWNNRASSLAVIR
jgi:hypothetical protein